MTDEQMKYWRQMIELVQRFIRGDVTLESMVSGLEGLLDISEVTEPSVREEFYKHWTRLEIPVAQGDGRSRAPVVLSAAEELLGFLTSVTSVPPDE